MKTVKESQDFNKSKPDKLIHHEGEKETSTLIENTKQINAKIKICNNSNTIRDKVKKYKPSLLTQLWMLVPFFLLHTGAGLAGGFTSILLDHFQPYHSPNVSKEHQNSCQQGNITWLGVHLTGDSTFCSQQDSSSFIIVLATAEDYAPILVSIFSGFLQQLWGPKRMLQMTVFPATLSWVLVLVNPHSHILVILSRFMAGLANGLLSSNVYAADMSHRENRQALKMIEGASRSLGFIFIYILQLIFWNHSQNIHWVAGISAILPIASFVGMFFREESLIFKASKAAKITPNDLKEENSLKYNLENEYSNEQLKRKKQTGRMKFPPFGSPSIYRPLILITCIICLQHCSGFAFTKKFLLQLLKPKNPKSDPRLATIFAIIIATIRLFSNLFMSGLIRTIRVRGLYFFSLFSTSSCLIILGLFLDDCIDISPVTEDLAEYISVVLLALHVFLVQFGLQSLSGNLMDILFPSMYRAVMKGVMRAITSITLVIIVFILTFNVNCVIKYSWTFWLMGGILLMSSPILWVFIPEVRNIGTKMATEFYQHNQTVFYFSIQNENRDEENQRTLEYKTEKKTPNQFMSNIDIKETKKLFKFPKLLKVLLKYGTKMHKLRNHIGKQEVHEKNGEDAQTVRFETAFDTIEEMQNDKIGKDENKERVSFIHNIHPHTGFLLKNKYPGRVLIGKGPIKLEDSFVLHRGGVFLFNDVVIISQCIQDNMRYVNDKCFNLSDQTFKITRNETLINFNDSFKTISVVFGNIYETKMWEKYINFYKNELETTGA